MRGETARDARRFRFRCGDFICGQRHFAGDITDHVRGNGTGRSTTARFKVLIMREVEDGRFDPNAACAAVDHAHGVAEFIAHVLRGGGGHVTEAVGRGAAMRPLPFGEFPQEFLRDRIAKGTLGPRSLARRSQQRGWRAIFF